MAKLIRNVHVPGHGWFGPAYEQPPAEVAALITNPGAWSFSDLELAELAELDAAAAVTRAEQAVKDAEAGLAGSVDSYSGTAADLTAAPSGATLHPPEIHAEGLDGADIAARIAAELSARTQHPAAKQPEAAPPAEPLDPPLTADRLSEIATDKPALLAYAKAAGIDVDGRLGAKKLHAAIAEKMQGRGPGSPTSGATDV